MGSKVVHLEIDPFPEGSKTILTELSALSINAFPLIRKFTFPYTDAVTYDFQNIYLTSQDYGAHFVPLRNYLSVFRFA